MQKTLLITGTGAGVGKTVVGLAIASYYQTFCQNKTLALFKPIELGTCDRQQYHSILSLQQPLDDISVACFDAFVEPPPTEDVGGQAVNLAHIWRCYQTLTQSYDLVLVEACGGLGTPLTPETTVADLAWDWRLPTLLVVPVSPGSIGQAIAHVALARQARIHLKGIVLNCLHPRSDDECAALVSPQLLQSLTQIPVLGTVPYCHDGKDDPAKLAHIASNLDIEHILPLL